LSLPEYYKIIYKTATNKLDSNGIDELHGAVPDVVMFTAVYRPRSCEYERPEVAIPVYGVAAAG